MAANDNQLWTLKKNSLKLTWSVKKTLKKFFLKEKQAAVKI